MIQENRDAAFWIAVAEHPMVAPHIGHMTAQQIAMVVAAPNVLPLASKNGGFFFIALDPALRVRELHTLYLPQGWGREAHGAAKEALEHVFGSTPAQLIETLELANNPRSQPPRTFGSVPCGEMAPSVFGGALTWALTKNAWLASPGRRSMTH